MQRKVTTVWGEGKGFFPVKPNLKPPTTLSASQIRGESAQQVPNEVDDSVVSQSYRYTILFTFSTP